MRNIRIKCIGVLTIALCALNAHAAETSEEPPIEDASVYEFEDTMLDEELVYPDWFTESFGNLNDALVNAAEAGKKGLIVYFGQKRCSYCEKFLKYNLEAPDIRNYLQNNFDVVPVDIWGVEDIVMLDGDTMTEREYAVFEGTNFTPSLIFYDLKGEQILRLRGYYPPYKFRAAMKYIVEGFYFKESLREYMARADPAMVFDPEGLNEQDFFAKPPYNLERRRFNSDIPLVVFFEQGKCHACDVLHTGPMADERLQSEVEKMEAVQLDMWSDEPVITPQGKRTTAKEWANELGLFYAPALVFFDEAGKEVMRVDAVTQFYRLLGIFNYINTRAYRTEKNYQLWNLSRRELVN
jgi:thioredoxin-related protein